MSYIKTTQSGPATLSARTITDDLEDRILARWPALWLEIGGGSDAGIDLEEDATAIEMLSAYGGEWSLKYETCIYYFTPSPGNTAFSSVSLGVAVGLAIAAGYGCND